MAPVSRTDSPLAVRYLDLTYDPHNSEKSALHLLHTLLPEWQQSPGKIELVRFTDGITNTVCAITVRHEKETRTDSVHSFSKQRNGGQALLKQKLTRMPSFFAHMAKGPMS